MSGWLTNGVPLVDVLTGSEHLPIDTRLAGGATPQSAALSLVRLATFTAYATNFASNTPVSGSRYYTSLSLGSAGLITGIQYLIGATGGTNNVLVELHNASGALVATSALAGVTVGTASTWQRVAFTVPYAADPGTYYIAIQMNGTTARFASYNAPSLPLFTGSATGVFGTSAAITPPTTYTQAVGPVALVY